jgi:hypothetical protein
MTRPRTAEIELKKAIALAPGSPGFDTKQSPAQRMRFQAASRDQRNLDRGEGNCFRRVRAERFVQSVSRSLT